MTWYKPTLFEQLIQYLNHLPRWLQASLLLGLLGLPYLIATLEQLPLYPLTFWGLRTVLFPPVAVAYIVAVAPFLWRAERAVIAGLAPLMERPLPTAGGTGVRWRTTWGDCGAFALGAVGGAFIASRYGPPEPRYWVDGYITFTYAIMFGALTWSIYAALASARLTALLHRNLRPFNPFDLAPFAPVGRQALVLALNLIGGTTLSLIFVYSPSLFFDRSNFVIYAVLTLTTLSVFFGVMWPAHRTLARVKADEQATLQCLIAQAFDQLKAALATGGAPQPLAAEFDTWLTLARRLDQAPTWPFNMEMLRTLGLWVLSPVFVALFRVIGLWLTEGHF